jgi:hypothetical protein
MYDIRKFKAFFIICGLLILLFTGCSDKKNPVDANEDQPLLGKWEVNLMSSEFQGTVETFSKNQLDSIGLIWTHEFKEDHSLIQVTNMSGPVRTMPGTWKKQDNVLLLTITGPNGMQGTLSYDYVCEEDVLRLEWEMSNGRKNHAEFLAISN